MNRLALSGLLCSFLIIGVTSITANANASPDVNAACLVPASETRSVTYPVRLKILGDDAKGLGSGVVTVSHQDGSDAFSVDCAKPQVIMRLPAGSYIVTVDAAGAPARNLRFRVVPSHSPKTLAMRFPSSSPALAAR